MLRCKKRRCHEGKFCSGKLFGGYYGNLQRSFDKSAVEEEGDIYFSSARNR